MNEAPALERWDLFCRVIDNLGDAAVMWRLARQLAREHRCRVRLFIDQPAVLLRLVPGAEPGRTIDGVGIRRMPDAAADANPRDADVVLTGFHAHLPGAYRRRMAPHRPTWINLEYLSAEHWIDDFHGLPSPQPDGLTEHYFYPGFTVRSGGLLREADLVEQREAFLADRANAQGFLASLGVQRRRDETLASLLCYPDAPLEALARQLAGSTARLHLVAPHAATGVATDHEAFAAYSRGRMKISQVPFLPQVDYDRLLWSCDLNFVRGEDSWIRAVWSGKPFIWQVYKQADAIHLRKLDAFLGLLAPVNADMPAGPRSALTSGARLLAQASRWWNDAPGAPDCAIVELLSRPARVARCLANLESRIGEADLATRLRGFAAAVRLQNLASVPSPGQL